MDKGYIKLWRTLLEKPIWLKSTAHQRSVLIAVLLMANHKQRDWEWKGDKFKVQRGEFVTSLESIRKLSGHDVSIQNVRSSLKRFEKLQFLTNKSTKHGRLIKVINWSDYQPDGKVGQHSTQQRPNKDPTKTQHLTRMEECKNKETKEYPFWLNQVLWSEYKEHRKAIKAKMTDLAESKAIAKLKRLIDSGQDQERVLSQSIEMGWKGLFEVKGGGSAGLKYTKQPECSKCGMIASSIKRGEPCFSCGEIA